MVHYEKKFYVIFILTILCVTVEPIRNFVDIHSVLVMQAVGLLFIGSGIYLIVNYINFNIHKNKGYYHQINATVREVEQKYEFIKHKFNILCHYYFPIVNYDVNGETCSYCCKNGNKNLIYKINDPFILYKDPCTGDIIEEKGKENNKLLAIQSLFIGAYIILFTFTIMGMV